MITDAECIAALEKWRELWAGVEAKPNAPPDHRVREVCEHLLLRLRNQPVKDAPLTLTGLADELLNISSHLDDEGATEEFRQPLKRAAAILRAVDDWIRGEVVGGGSFTDKVSRILKESPDGS